MKTMTHVQKRAAGKRGLFIGLMLRDLPLYRVSLYLARILLHYRGLSGPDLRISVGFSLAKFGNALGWNVYSLDLEM